MVNTDRLRGAWISKGYTDKQFAKAINVNKSTLSRWLHGSSDSIPFGKVLEMVKVLHLENEEVNRIFLAK